VTYLGPFPYFNAAPVKEEETGTDGEDKQIVRAAIAVKIAVQASILESPLHCEFYIVNILFYIVNILEKLYMAKYTRALTFENLSQNMIADKQYLVRRAISRTLDVHVFKVIIEQISSVDRGYKNKYRTGLLSLGFSRLDIGVHAHSLPAKLLQSG
jgi:hypothetical protein